MKTIVKKCPKDGIVYDAAFGGTCESCFGPLQFYCTTHNQWLVDETCNLCPKPAVVPAATEPKNYWFGLVMVAVLAVLVGSGLIIWRIVAPREKKTKTVKPSPPPPAPVAAVVPVAKPIPPSPPVQAPVVLSLRQILDDPEPALGKWVQTTGALQFLDTRQATFDLRVGDYSVSVQYGTLPAKTRAVVDAAPAGREVVVVGILQRDESLNALYLVAQRLEWR